MTNVQLPLEVSVAETTKLLRAAEPPLLLDVRETDERDYCRLDDQLHIPIGQIQGGWQRLPDDRHIVIYCHHGMRSLRVAQFLRAMGLTRVQSMRGGIEAWSLEIDPSVPRY